MKGLRTKAEDAVVERKDKIHDAVEKVQSTADEKTGGKYHEKIQSAGAKTVGLVDGLQAGDGDAPSDASRPQAGAVPGADAASEGGTAEGAPAEGASGAGSAPA
ncbi:MAG TPA: antitoxin [Solirubrobacteraceae bacterium]|nr:antitoxin [Solirubrobacteraceae bacterium]